MNCETFRERIAILPVLRSEFDLDPESSEHLRRCVRCSRVAADRMALDVLLDASTDLAVPPRLKSRVLERVEWETAQPPLATKSLVRRTTITLSAAALVVLALTLFHLQRSVTVIGDPPVEQAPEADMVANLELLLDWDLLVEHADDLDLVRAEPLIRAVTEDEDGEQG